METFPSGFSSALRASSTPCSIAHLQLSTNLPPDSHFQHLSPTQPLDDSSGLLSSLSSFLPEPLPNSFAAQPSSNNALSLFVSPVARLSSTSSLTTPSSPFHPPHTTRGLNSSYDPCLPLPSPASPAPPPPQRHRGRSQVFSVQGPAGEADGVNTDAVIARLAHVMHTSQTSFPMPSAPRHTAAVSPASSPLAPRASSVRHLPSPSPAAGSAAAGQARGPVGNKPLDATASSFVPSVSNHSTGPAGAVLVSNTITTTATNNNNGGNAKNAYDQLSQLAQSDLTLFPTLSNALEVEQRHQQQQQQQENSTDMSQATISASNVSPPKPMAPLLLPHQTSSAFGDSHRSDLVSGAVGALSPSKSKQPLDPLEALTEGGFNNLPRSTLREREANAEHDVQCPGCKTVFVSSSVAEDAEFVAYTLSCFRKRQLDAITQAVDDTVKAKRICVTASSRAELLNRDVRRLRMVLPRIHHHRRSQLAGAFKKLARLADLSVKQQHQPQPRRNNNNNHDDDQEEEEMEADELMHEGGLRLDSVDQQVLAWTFGQHPRCMQQQDVSAARLSTGMLSPRHAMIPSPIFNTRSLAKQQQQPQSSSNAAIATNISTTNSISNNNGVTESLFASTGFGFGFGFGDDDMCLTATPNTSDALMMATTTPTPTPSSTALSASASTTAAPLMSPGFSTPDHDFQQPQQQDHATHIINNNNPFTETQSTIDHPTSSSSSSSSSASSSLPFDFPMSYESNEFLNQYLASDMQGVPHARPSANDNDVDDDGDLRLQPTTRFQDANEFDLFDRMHTSASALA